MLMKMEVPPGPEVSPRPPPRAIWKWIELRHGLDQHAVDNNNRLYLTTWRRNRNDNNVNTDLIDISLRDFGEMMRVNFNQIQRHVDNPLPRGVQYVSWLRNRESPPLPAVSPPPPPPPSWAPWETAARGWLVGAALFMFVLLLAKFLDRWIVNRLIKVRERRRSSQWSTPNVVATSIPEMSCSGPRDESPPPPYVPTPKDPPPPYCQVALPPVDPAGPLPTTSHQPEGAGGAGSAAGDHKDIVIPNGTTTNIDIPIDTDTHLKL